jgi:hypothetical protein
MITIANHEPNRSAAGFANPKQTIAGQAHILFIRI